MSSSSPLTLEVMQLDFELDSSCLRALRTGALAVEDRLAVFSIVGPGALTCLQGLLTSDLAAAGEHGLVYGAILTSKGMILVDAWLWREGERFTLLVAQHARETAAQHFARVLPPRLAAVRDLSESWSAVWLLGPLALERFARATSSPLPSTGRVTAMGMGRESFLAAGPALAPFGGLAVGPLLELAPMLERFERGGARLGDPAAVAAARVLAGWPTLGREIDERTLPQEVRYDELGAVSYVKGCYTGQETVARVHFRGHVNRSLRGVILDAPGKQALDDRSLKAASKDAGVIRTALRFSERIVALASVRREIPEGATLLAGSCSATVVPLPFEPALVG